MPREMVVQKALYMFGSIIRRELICIPNVSRMYMKKGIKGQARYEYKRIN